MVGLHLVWLLGVELPSEVALTTRLRIFDKLSGLVTENKIKHSMGWLVGKVCYDLLTAHTY